MNKLVVCLYIMICFYISIVSALVVSPVNPVLSTVWYTSTVANLTVTNDANYSITNLTWSPISFMSFPSSVDLNPNESRVVTYNVYTNELFTNRNLVSTLSFFYSVNSSPPVRSFEVNISSSGFTLIPTLMSNDSIVWHNLLPSIVTLNDLSTGFPVVNIPVGGSVSVVYLGLHSYAFYIVQNGIVGNFNVVSRSGTSFAHDSSFDKQLSWSLSSILPASTMSVIVLSPNISVNNNATYLEALIEVRNLDPNLVIQNVVINGSRWIGNFSPNGFNLPAGGVQRVLFNITPFVDKTNLTNRSHKVILSIQSSNAGSTVKEIDVFIKYQNMDVLTIGGVNYTITVLGINATIEACLQHMNDVGFEKCLDLGKYFTRNITIIKEIPAKLSVSEDVAQAGWDSVAGAKDIAVRLENKQNLYLDRQALTNAKMDNNTDALLNLSSYVLVTSAERNARVQSMNLRFWLTISFTLFFLLLFLIVNLLVNIELFDAYERAGQ